MIEPKRLAATSRFPFLASSVLDLMVLVSMAVTLGLYLVLLQDLHGLTWLDGFASKLAAAHGNGVLDNAMVGATRLGEELVLIAISVALVVWARSARGVLWGRFFLLAMSGAVLLDNIIKPFVGRARPGFDRLVPGTGYSFPSGHVIGTTVLLTALAIYLSHGQTWRRRSTMWTIAILGTIVMAVSRVYLGVHWPTDALAGTAIGALWTWVSYHRVFKQVEHPARIGEAIPTLA